ncbi:MAG: serine protease [Candidatus Desulfaltia sp.]|nr:serine protease [Candidatus Desulfaltia sp.]
MPENHDSEQEILNSDFKTDQEDAEFFEYLNERFNEDDEDDEDDEDNENDAWSGGRRHIPLFIKLTAVFVFVIFTVIVLANFLQVFNMPSHDFFSESRILGRDPVIKELKKAVVQVRVVTGEGKGYSAGREQKGTGFNIRDDGLIVTNDHLIRDASSISVSFPGRGTFQAVEWYGSPFVDLAIISLEAKGLPFLELEKNNSIPMAGDEVTVIGNPLNFTGVALRGKVDGYYNVDGLSVPVLILDTTIYRGNSGSPVFNKDNRVVGVIFASSEGRNGEKNRGLAVHISLLQEILDMQ